MTTQPGQSAILNSGYSKWQAPLAALFSGLSAVGQPGGWGNFGVGVGQGLQNFQQGQQNQQMMDLRRMQIEQAEAEMRRANQEREQEQARQASIRQSLARFTGSPTDVQPVGNYGAATGGVQTASGPSPIAAMFGGDPQKAALFTEYADAYPEQAYQMLVERGFAEPEKPKTTDDLTEYESAVNQGYPGSFMDYQLDLRKAGASTNTSNINMKSYGDIPAGHRLVETPEGVVMEKIPGSPAADAEANRDDAAALTADVVTTDINRTLETMDKAVLPTTGMIGGMLSGVPGTASRDVAGLVQTIKGNIGIDKLQAMRMQSPTGGALGNVTEGELAVLQSTIGNLEQSQSDDQVRENLKRVYNLYLDTVHGKGKGGKRYELKQPKGPDGDSGELRYDSEGNPL
jgi:hypothetical protein